MRTKLISIVLVACLWGIAGYASEETATTDEIHDKLLEAIEVIQILSQEGDDWVNAFNNPQSEFVWKDTYVWPIDSEKKMNVAHPMNQSIVGKDLSGIKCKKTGKLFYQEFLTAADNPNGIWVEYWWAKPGEPADKLFRKLTCVVPVPNTPYLVAAGIYDDKASIEELNSKLQK